MNKPPLPTSVGVEYDLRPSSDGKHILVSVTGGSLTDLDFALRLHGLGECAVTSREDGWRVLQPIGAREPILSLSEHLLVVATGHPWRRFVANLAVNHVLSLQDHALFFHGASVGIEGRGALLLGPKESGKTTLALALASRGHAFNGDEIAGVDMRTLTLVPVPRAASVREGPSALRVADALARRTLPKERLADGTLRSRACVSSLFADARPARVPLSAIIVLGSRRDQPRLREIAPRWGDAARTLGLLRCSLGGRATGSKVMQLLRLLERVRCFRLDVGSPDSTASFIEEMVSAA